MKPEQVIQWAKKTLPNWYRYKKYWYRYKKYEAELAELTRFAELVAQHEREECAKLADSMNTFGHPPNIADAIRSRGQKGGEE